MPFDLQSTRKVLKFYGRVAIQDCFFSMAIIITGLASRILSICVFMAMVKVFLGILSPEQTLVFINNALAYFSIPITTEEGMLNAMIIMLFVLVLLQYISSRLNLFLFTSRRHFLVKKMVSTGLNDNPKMNLHLGIDHFPSGYDGILKCGEIALFFVLLLIVIFSISFVAGMLVFLMIPPLISTLIVKSRKEVHTVKEIREHRQKFDENTGSIDTYNELLNTQYRFARKNIIYSELMGGLVIVAIMLFFFLGNSAIELHDISALVLIFAIRFSVIYAGEFSRHANRLFQQRLIINQVTNPKYAK